MRLTFTSTAIDPVDGQQYTVTHEYEIRDADDERHRYAALSVYKGTVDTSGLTTLFSDMDAFKTLIQSRLDDQVRSWLARREAERKQEAALARFDAEAGPLFDQHFAGEDTFPRRAFREAVEQDPAAIERVMAFLREERKTSGAFRKAVRGVVSEGKALARDEFSTDYDDAEEKDDFYEDNITTVAEGILSAI